MEGIGFALAGMLMWGLAPLAGKLGLAKLPAAPALALRSFTISALMLVYMAATRQFGAWSTAGARSLGAIALEGLLASLVGHFLYYQALRAAPAGTVAAVMAGFPVVTVLAGVLLLGEALTLKKLGGVVLVVAGVLVLRT
jgi:transporter family protein